MYLAQVLQSNYINPHIHPVSQDKYRCSVCNEEASDLCVGCDSSPYCSIECFETDYPLHKLLCPQYKTTKASNSGDMLTRTIFFPDSCDKPCFTWISTDWINKGYLKNTADGPLGEGEIEMLLVGHNFWPGTLMRIYRMKDSRICANSSIMRVTGGQAPHVWTGPVLAVVEPGLSQELDMPAFQNLCAFFGSYDPVKNRHPKLAAKIKKIKAVRINGIGYESRFENPDQPFRPVEISLAHPVFSEQMCCDLPAVAGIPLYIHQYDKKFYNGRLGNMLAENLLGCGNITSKQWGEIPSCWKGKTNAALVARQDGKDLLPQHVEALCAWCQNCFQALFSDPVRIEGITTEESEGQEGRKRLFERAARHNFEKYWRTFCEQRAVIDESWKDISSPYQIENTGAITSTAAERPEDESYVTLQDRAYTMVKNEASTVVNDETKATSKDEAKNEANATGLAVAGAAVKDEVKDEIKHEVKDAPMNKVKNEVMNEIKDEVMNKVKNEVKNEPMEETKVKCNRINEAKIRFEERVNAMVKDGGTVVHKDEHSALIQTVLMVKVDTTVKDEKDAVVKDEADAIIKEETSE